MVWHSTKTLSSARPTSMAVSSKSLYPLTNYVKCDKFSNQHKKFLANVTAISEPTRYSDAVTNPNWREVMQQEITVLENNGT